MIWNEKAKVPLLTRILDFIISSLLDTPQKTMSIFLNWDKGAVNHIVFPWQWDTYFTTLIAINHNMISAWHNLRFVKASCKCTASTNFVVCHMLIHICKNGNMPSKIALFAIVCWVENIMPQLRLRFVSRMATQFTKPNWYDPLLKNKDALPGRHANTHLAQVYSSP